MSREDLVSDAVQALQRVQRTLAVTVWDRLTDYDIGIRQLKALHVVADCGECSVGALGERLGVKLPAASIQADNLVQAGLLERREDPEDRRRVQLRLTPRGEEIMQGRREIGLVLRRWFEQLPDEDLAALARGLGRLAVVVPIPAPDSEPEAAARNPG